MYTWPQHSISCDHEPECSARLQYTGYTHEGQLITTAVARRLLKQDGWSVTPVRSVVSKKIRKWILLCPDHKELTSESRRSALTPRRKESTMTRYVVELYRGEAPDAIGTALEDWDGALDDATTAWLTKQGWGTDDPDLWVNIRRLPDEQFAPNNDPVATRTMTTIELNRGDRVLAEMLAAMLGRAGETTIPDGWDARQDDAGWTWDSGHNPGKTSWQRIEGYHAADWPKVKEVVVRLANDAAWLERC